MAKAVKEKGWEGAAQQFGVSYKTLNRWCHLHETVAKAVAPYRTVRG